MNTQRISFHVETTNDPESPYRATIDDDFVTWGYGDTPQAAITELLEELPADYFISE